MTEIKEIYKCGICGNIVEVVHASGGILVCCGQPMTLQVENTVDAAKEKHVPVVEAVEGGVLVKVGAVEHPMVDAHYIEWIEIQTENKVYRKYLKPGDKPEALFILDEKVLTVREYCNLHGLWKA
ncbi:desulfoferrodoxin [Clostridium psychrophilum]|uniref:desulfoferrodoxin n=1 Tax=Clostridium psychrophilum TaxID=132926 RepID=UPI001C0C4B36|nr:desulfoferrodoxin [Clostridium psychrophilum]MBU3182356.1 desulfoferrodoxin [Clostridium psychrophilum]